MQTLPFKTTENHIADLSTAISYWYDKAKGLYTLNNWQRPVFTVSQLKGSCGGKAEYLANKVMVNFALYKENKNEYLMQTVGHEVAHLATFQRYGLQRIVANAHGDEWKSVMSALGLPPNRCHSYDVSNVKQNRARNRYLYNCSCAKPLYLTVIQHKKSDKFVCNTCRARLKFTGQVINIDA